MVFTTQNNQLLIFKKSIDDIKDGFLTLFDIYEQYGIKGENGVLSSIFGSGKSRQTVLTSATISQFKNFQEIFNNTSKSADVVAEEIGNVDESIVSYARTCRNGEISMAGFTASLESTTAKAIALKAATVALNAALGIIITLIASKAISLISDWIHRTDNLIEQSEKAADNIKSISDEFKSAQTTVSELGEKFAELSQGVDSLTGENISLSYDDYQEFLDISNQLGETFPLLSRTYDENGNAIVRLDGNAKTITETLEGLLDVERQLANAEIAENLPDLYAGIKAKSDKYEKDLKEWESQREDINEQLEGLSQADIIKGLNSGFDSGFFDVLGDEYSTEFDYYNELLNSVGLDYTVQTLEGKMRFELTDIPDNIEDIKTQLYKKS